MGAFVGGGRAIAVSPTVMAGLDPAILYGTAFPIVDRCGDTGAGVDARVEPGHDDGALRRSALDRTSSRGHAA